MEKRGQIEIEAEMEKLAQAEASEAFELFKSVLHKKATSRLAMLLASSAMSRDEERDCLERLREDVEIINAMPGKRWSLYQEWMDLMFRAEKSHESRFRMKNQKLVERYEAWKRTSGGNVA